MNKLHRFILVLSLTTVTALVAQPGPDSAPRGAPQSGREEAKQPRPMLLREEDDA